MALTYAHSDGREAFEWADIVEAITTIESGTAQNIEYAPDQSRATAIHEAGHAIASHIYVSNAEHTRLSIRKRGRSLGHYQRMLKEERVEGIAFRHEEIANLVVTLGAMAAEHVFYGENSTGVGGDVRSVTTEVGLLVGAAAIGPEPVDLCGRVPEDERERSRAGDHGPLRADRDADHEPAERRPVRRRHDRRGAQRSLQAARGGADPGPGVHHRAGLHAPQPRGASRAWPTR